MKWLDRLNRDAPINRCGECGSSHLLVTEQYCRDCVQHPTPLGRDFVVVGGSSPTGPPPRAPGPSMLFDDHWTEVETLVSEGVRYELTRQTETGAHRIIANGVEIWATDIDDSDAAAEELARRVSAPFAAPDQDLADDVPADEEDHDQAEDLEVAGSDEDGDDWNNDGPRPTLPDGWKRHLSSGRYRFQLVTYWVRLWWVGFWWLLSHWYRFTLDTDAVGAAVREKALRGAGTGAKEQSADGEAVKWRRDHLFWIKLRLGTQLAALILTLVIWTVTSAARSVSVWRSSLTREPFDWDWVLWPPHPTITASAVVVAVTVPAMVGRKVKSADIRAPRNPVSIHKTPNLRKNPGLVIEAFRELGGAKTRAAFKRQDTRDVPACTWYEDLRVNELRTGLVCKVKAPESAAALLKAENAEDEFAAAIGHTSEQVRLTHDPADPANVVSVFIARRQLGDLDAGAWPWANRVSVAGAYFDGVPVAIDETGSEIRITLAGCHGLVGGVTNSGKTAGIRALLLGLALDPDVVLYTVWKGGADGVPFNRVSHRNRMGNDPSDLAGVLADLKGLKTTTLLRMKFQQNHPEFFPTGEWEANVVDKGPQYAAELGEHLARPIVVFIDEARFLVGDPDVKEELLWLIAQARSFGITILLATQRPDREAIHGSITGQAQLKVCFRVDTSSERDIILGTGARCQPYARMLPKRGMAYMGTPDMPGRGKFRVKFYFVPLQPEADQILERAAEARRARGLLTGMAAGLEPADTSTDTIIDHVGQLPDWGRNIHGADLAVLLAENFPAYVGATAARILGMLRDHGVETPQIETEVQYGPDAGKRKNRNGIHRAGFDEVSRKLLLSRAVAAETEAQMVAELRLVTDTEDDWDHEWDEDEDTGSDHFPADGTEGEL